MRKVLVALIGLFMVAAALPEAALAQVSKDFPNTEGAPCLAPTRNVPSIGGGGMNFKIKLQGYPMIDSGPVAAVACDGGETVAVKAANALCNAAAADPAWTVSGIFPGACAPEAACCVYAAGATRILAITSVAVPADAFLLTHSAGASKVEAAPADSEVITNFLHRTNAGNYIGTDPLNFWLFDVSGGTASDPTFRVHHACGGTNPAVFSVDATGKSPFQVATEVANGFNTLGLACTTLPATVHSNGEISRYTSLPGEFHGAYFVRVRNVQSVLQIDVKGQPGESITGEGNNGATASVPTLNEWGVGILVVVMLVTSLWFLRRRVRAV